MGTALARDGAQSGAQHPRRPSSASALARRLSARRGELVAKLAEHGLRNVRVFGSVATDRDNADSDVDLLVTATQPISLMGLAGAELDAAAILEADVDLVLDRSIRPDLEARILGEAVPIEVLLL